MAEEIPADSVKKDPAVSSSSEKKDLSTASPGKSEGVPAGSPTETKDPSSASPEKSEEVQAESESSEKRGASSPRKWEKGAESPAEAIEGRFPESSPEKRCCLDYKGKGVVVDEGEEVKSAPVVVGVHSPLANVDTGALDSSSETRCRSDYKGKAVAVESDEGTAPGARIGGSGIVVGIPAFLPNEEDFWQDFDPYGEEENPTAQVDPTIPVVGDKASESLLLNFCSNCLYL